MRVTAGKTVVLYKLIKELQAAGVPALRIASIPNNGIQIQLADEDQSNDFLDIVNTVIGAHDGIDDIAIVEADAKQRLKAIPGYATWTEEEALTWHDTNLSDEVIDGIANLAGAKIILKKISTENRALVRMVLALRDKLYPNLEK